MRLCATFIIITPSVVQVMSIQESVRQLYSLQIRSPGENETHLKAVKLNFVAPNSKLACITLRYPAPKKILDGHCSLNGYTDFVIYGGAQILVPKLICVPKEP